MSEGPVNTFQILQPELSLHQRHPPQPSQPPHLLHSRRYPNGCPGILLTATLLGEVFLLALLATPSHHRPYFEDHLCAISY